MCSSRKRQSFKTLLLREARLLQLHQRLEVAALLVQQLFLRAAEQLGVCEEALGAAAAALCRVGEVFRGFALCPDELQVLVRLLVELCVSSEPRLLFEVPLQHLLDSPHLELEAFHRQRIV